MSTSPFLPATWLCPQTADTSSSPLTHPGSSCTSCQVRRAVQVTTSPDRAPPLSCAALPMLHCAPGCHLTSQGLPSSAALPWLCCTVLLRSGVQLPVDTAPCCRPLLRMDSSAAPAQSTAGHKLMAPLTPCAVNSDLCCAPPARSQLHLPHLHQLCSADFTQARNFFGLQIEDKFHQPCAVWHRSGHYIIAAAAGQAFVFHVGTTKVWQLLNYTVTPGFVLSPQQAVSGCWLSSAWLTLLCVCTI